MNKEEKERIKHLIERCNECKLNACITCDICWSEVQAIDELYNLIEKQQAEIETLKQIISKTSVQFINDTIEIDKKNKEDLEMLYKGCQTEIEILKREFKIVDHECSRLEQEDIKKDKIINEMIGYIAGLDVDEDICKNVDCDEYTDEETGDINCKHCIKQYFERKIEQ